MKIKTIRDMEELETIRPYWEGWQCHPNSDFEHFKLVCKLRPEILCPYVIVIEENSQPRLLLAGRLEQTSFSPAIGYFRPVRIPAKVLVIIYQGLLGEKSVESAEALVQYLWSLVVAGEADAVVFHNLPDHSPLLSALLRCGPRWWCEKKFAWSMHWTMNLPEGHGSALQNFGSKHRNVIRKKQRKLESGFPNNLSWRWITKCNDVSDLCKRLEAVAAGTYQRGLAVGFSDNEEKCLRYEFFSNRGQLRVQELVIKNKVEAYWAGTVYGDTYYVDETGFNPNLSPYSPGTVGLIRMAETLAREGVKIFDFGFGDAVYKSRYGNQYCREATVRLFAPTTKGFALRSSIGFIGWLNNLGRKLLKQMKMLDRLKKQWRRQITPHSKDEE